MLTASRRLSDSPLPLIKPRPELLLWFSTLRQAVRLTWRAKSLSEDFAKFRNAVWQPRSGYLAR
ncbi:hypothetical protein BV20DRAFT_974144 [Pilatotrama ljubarskyi]|nr:hypothetical protein BV20DRAFT_974144 [Pilatotrama ljubarskyi]